MTNLGHPLTEQHLNQINEALGHCAKGQHQCNLAKLAGIDVSAQEKQLADMHAQLTRIKQVYFPGR